MDRQRWDDFTRASNERALLTLRVHSPRSVSPRNTYGALPAAGRSPRIGMLSAHNTHPEYHPPSFHTDSPSRRRMRPTVLAKASAPAANAVTGEDKQLAAAGVHKVGVTAKEVQNAMRDIRQHWETKYFGLQKGFLMLDDDKDGHISRKEFDMIVRMFNLEVRKPVVDTLFELADCKHLGYLDFPELQRMLTSEDALHMRMDRLNAVKAAPVDRAHLHDYGPSAQVHVGWEEMRDHTHA